MGASGTPFCHPTGPRGTVEVPIRYDTKTGKRAKRESRIDARTTRHDGYAVSQVIRKMIETLFGDGKQHGGRIRQVKLRGQPKVSDVFMLSMLAVNLRRLPKLFAVQTIMAGSG